MRERQSIENCERNRPNVSKAKTYFYFLYGLHRITVYMNRQSTQSRLSENSNKLAMISTR